MIAFREEEAVAEDDYESKDSNYKVYHIAPSNKFFHLSRLDVCDRHVQTARASVSIWIINFRYFTG